MTSKEQEVLGQMTEYIIHHLEEDGIVRVTKDGLIIYKSVTNKDAPQNKFIELLIEHCKSYGVAYEETEHCLKVTANDFRDLYVCDKLATN